MDARGRTCRWSLAGVLFASLGLASGCGGGGGGGGGGTPPPPEPTLSRVEPAVFSTVSNYTFAVHGANLGATDDLVRVRFTASSGTPFDGGTSATAEVIAGVISPSVIHGSSPHDVVTQQTVCDVTVLWRDDTTANLPNSVVFREPAKVYASDAMTNDRFGASVAISGDTFLVGCPQGGGFDFGGAYVFARSGASWVEQQKLMGSEVSEGDDFGDAVAISGDTAAVGAHLDGEYGVEAGAVYVFVRSGGTWTEQDVVRAPDGDSFDHFGCSVALDGDTLLVGAYAQASGPIDGPGAAYVFTRSGTVWILQNKLSVPGANNGDRIGWSVGLHGDLAVLGAPHDDAEAGTTYVFAREGTSWALEQRVDAPSRGPFRRFGESVAVWGSMMVVGAPNDVAPDSGSGMAYVFHRGTGAWSDVDVFPPYFGYDYGRSVSAWEGRVAIGGREDDGTGRCDLHAYDDGEWTWQTVLNPPEDGPANGFGDAVALSASTVVAGAAEDDDEDPDAGAAYGF